MTVRNTVLAYGSAAKFFHWLIFFIIAGLLTAGFIMTGMPATPDKFKLYGLHKSFGITVLTLAVLRLGWRFINIVPALPNTLRAFEKFAAHASHIALYVLMFAMPLSGWGMSSAAGLSVSVFGWFTLPNLVAPDNILKGQLRDLHGWLAWALIVMVAIHIWAALLHHFYYKDNVLKRMLPSIQGKKYVQDVDTGC